LSTTALWSETHRCVASCAYRAPSASHAAPCRSGCPESPRQVGCAPCRSPAPPGSNLSHGLRVVLCDCAVPAAGRARRAGRPLFDLRQHASIGASRANSRPLNGEMAGRLRARDVNPHPWRAADKGAAQVVRGWRPVTWRDCPLLALWMQQPAARQLGNFVALGWLRAARER